MREPSGSCWFTVRPVSLKNQLVRHRQEVMEQHQQRAVTGQHRLQEVMEHRQGDTERLKPAVTARLPQREVMERLLNLRQADTGNKTDAY